MSKFAIIQDGLVVNMVEWEEDSEWEAPEGCTVFEAPETVGIGWSVVDNEWVAPPAPDPAPQPEEDPAVLNAKLEAVNQLTALGITEDVARTIVGLPPIT